MLPADSALLNRKIIVCITQKLVNNWQNNSYSPYTTADPWESNTILIGGLTFEFTCINFWQR